MEHPSYRILWHVCSQNIAIVYISYMIISSVLQLQYCEKPCVEFTADQYREIIKLRFQNQGNIEASLDICVKNWMDTKYNCKTWNQYIL